METLAFDDVDDPLDSLRAMLDGFEGAWPVSAPMDMPPERGDEEIIGFDGDD